MFCRALVVPFACLDYYDKLTALDHHNGNDQALTSLLINQIRTPISGTAPSTAMSTISVSVLVSNFAVALVPPMCDSQSEAALSCQDWVFRRTALASQVC
jgi:hypothetical protein